MSLPDVYEPWRDTVVEVIESLLEHEHLECNGGAIAVRLPDGAMMMTPTGAAVRRWCVEPEDLVVMSVPGGEVIEKGRYPSAASTVQCLQLLETFPEVGAIIHTHAPWSLVYATLGVDLPCAITSMRRYGQVPCIDVGEHELKERFRAEPWPVPVPEAMNTSRPDVAAVNARIAQEVISLMADRAEELAWHGLAFTMAAHGLVVMSSTLEKAVQDVTAIEANCRAAYLAGTLHAGRAPVAAAVG